MVDACMVPRPVCSPAMPVSVRSERLSHDAPVRRNSAMGSCVKASSRCPTPLTTVSLSARTRRMLGPPDTVSKGALNGSRKKTQQSVLCSTPPPALSSCATSHLPTRVYALGSARSTTYRSRRSFSRCELRKLSTLSASMSSSSSRPLRTVQFVLLSPSRVSLTSPSWQMGKFLRTPDESGDVKGRLGTTSPGRPLSSRAWLKEREKGSRSESVSYTHLRLPTNREV